MSGVKKKHVLQVGIQKSKTLDLFHTFRTVIIGTYLIIIISSINNNSINSGVFIQNTVTVVQNNNMVPPKYIFENNENLPT